MFMQCVGVELEIYCEPNVKYIDKRAKKKLINVRLWINFGFSCCTAI